MIEKLRPVFLGLLSVLLLLMLVWPAVTAQEAVPQEPVLTETQRLQFQVLSQQMEIAQLKFEAARSEITRLVLSVHVPGYTFDLATLSYRAEPPKIQGEVER